MLHEFLLNQTIIKFIIEVNSKYNGHPRSSKKGWQQDPPKIFTFTIVKDFSYNVIIPTFKAIIKDYVAIYF